MPEDTPQPPPAPAEQSTAPKPIPFDIGEEYGTAKKNLPPITIVLIAIAILAVIAGIAIFVQRPHSETTGSITDIVPVDVPGQNMVMVAMNVSLQNRSDQRYWIKSIQAALDTKDGHFTDDAASAIDFERYFQAFPALKASAQAPLITETKIASGQLVSGTVIVSFPVTADEFANRKLLTLTIQPYDSVPLIIRK